MKRLTLTLAAGVLDDKKVQRDRFFSATYLVNRKSLVPLCSRRELRLLFF